MLFIDDTPFPDIFIDNKDKTHLFQGDIIRKEALPDFEEELLGFIIISNSCDLNSLKDKDLISISPIYPFSFVFNDMIKNATNQAKKEINRINHKGDKIKKIDYFKYFVDKLCGFIKEEANYVKKYTFFISPLKKFNNNPSIANLKNILSIKKNYSEVLLKNRIISLKSPWSETLGYKVGNLFNRVATYTPEIKGIKKWSETVFEDIYKEKKEELKKLI